MLKQRVITALLLLPFAIWLLFFPSLLVFSIILLPVFAILAWEWSNLIEANKVVKMVSIVGTMALIAGGFYLLHEQSFFTANNDVFVGKNRLSWFADYPFKIWQVAIMAWILAVVLVMLYPKAIRSWGKGPWIRMLFGWIMLPATWLAVVVIRSAPHADISWFGGWLLLLMFLIIWGADAGAYFAGKAFGKHKLAKVVSPNKTWEGAFGGLLIAVAASTGIGMSVALPLEWAQYLLVAAFLVVVSIFGDLFISMLKRKAEVKDTSNILPGHGGLLDRLDSTIAVAPFFVVILFWLDGIHA